MTRLSPQPEQVLVFRGVSWQATHFQALLEAEDIAVRSTYLPTFEVHELYVTPSRSFDALRIVDDGSRFIAERELTAEDGVDPELASLQVLGRRIRHLALSTIAAPAGVVLGVVYVVRASRAARRPVGHGDTMLAWAACWLLSTAGGLAAMTFVL